MSSLTSLSKAKRLAISYIRFSSKRQEKGDSVRRQSEAFERFCRNHDLEPASLKFADLGVSSFRGKNREEGEFGEFLAALDAGKIPKGAVLVIEAFDRAGRDEVDLMFTMICKVIRAGVDVGSCEDNRIFTRSDLSNVSAILTMILKIIAAREYSQKLSDRASNGWKGKRIKAVESRRPLTGAAPAWLKLREDKSGFELIPESAAVVQRIIRDLARGFGSGALERRLNAERVPQLGYRCVNGWRSAYIVKISKNRAVLGEYQPHVYVDGVRTPVGDPIPDYYPRIVSDQEWHACQAAMSGRKISGRRGKAVTNLFTGMLFDVRDGGSCVVKKKRPTLPTVVVSDRAARKIAGTHYVSFPYDALEYWLLRYTSELTDTDLSDHAPVDKLRAAEGRLGAITKKRQQVQAVADAEEAGDGLSSTLKLLASLDQQHAEAAREVEQLRNAVHGRDEGRVTEIFDLIKRMQEATGEERVAIREQLRGAIRQIVDKVWCLFVPGGDGERLALVQCDLKSGKRRCIKIVVPRRGDKSISPHGARGHLEPMDPKTLPFDLSTWHTLRIDGATLAEVDEDKLWLAVDSADPNLSRAADIELSTRHGGKPVPYVEVESTAFACDAAGCRNALTLEGPRKEAFAAAGQQKWTVKDDGRQCYCPEHAGTPKRRRRPA